MLILKFFLKLNTKNNSIKINLISNINDLPNKNFYNHDIMQDRSRSYLNWRFVKNPDDFKIYNITYNEIYIGFMVLKEVTYKNTKSLYLADFNIDNKYLKIINLIFSKVLIDLDINKYAYIATWLSKKSIFWKPLLLMFPIKLKKIQLIVKDNTEDKTFFKIDSKKIHFTLSDTDNI